MLAESCFRLMKKKQEFEWEEKQQEAMDTSKLAHTTGPALKPIAYVSTGNIILSVDSRLQG